ncbi:IS3 family transposase [Streptomyces avermitilis]|uniref:IS3 family transposase n=1 Tax=Streptomyces avermitilis TaxID=33903 RepID=UPI0036744E2E
MSKRYTAEFKRDAVALTLSSESWFAILKAEIGTTVWETRKAARADVFRYIEIEYNRSRLRRHPEYGYLTPLETRTLLRQDLTPAA